jgi:DNA-binding Lrp family transcriptional regulator
MKHAQNIDGIQKVNRCRVLKLMLENEKISRADIARKTGLNKATITNIINEFSDMNIVVSCGPISDSNGRKTAGLSLNLGSVVVLTIRINRGVIDFGVCSMMGEISTRFKKYFRLNDKIEKILETIKAGIEEMIAACSTKKILAISVAILGPLLNKIARVSDMPELAKVDIQEEITKMFPDIKVFLDHDANMSSFAEWREYKLNTGRHKGTMLTLDFGAGIDGAIMIDGRLFRGSLGIAGEIGQMA